MPDDLESLYHLGRSHNADAYDRGKQDGIEQGILLTKIHIVKWLLNEGQYKVADHIAKHILSLSSNDIVKEIESLEKPLEATKQKEEQADIADIEPLKKPLDIPFRRV